MRWLGDETFGDPPQPKQPGAQVFPGFTPDNALDRTRNNIGAYVGIESSPVRIVNVDVGARFERYSDFGSAFIGKAAGRVEAVRGLSLRGAISSGFRAPSLQQLWFNNVSTQFVTNPMSAENPDNDEHFGGKFLFDAEVSYRFHPALALSVGAYNIFNTFPDRQTKDANISSGRFIYSRNVLQFGQNGGFYYARLQLSWL